MAENGFLDITNRLQIPASTWEDGRQGLANIQPPWMLVLDNADDPNIDCQDYFPPGSSGIVVLTSRNAECKQYATADFVFLEGLPADEAEELLLKAADVADDQHLMLEDDARVVATLLQSHPLALIQAGAYVARGHCTLADYPQVYERQRKRLLGFRPLQAKSRYRDVYATFEASVEILQASHTEAAQDALQLLPLLAVGGPSQLPLRLFEAAWNGAQSIPAAPYDEENDLRLTQWHVSRLPLLMQANTDAWDSFRLVEAAHALRAFALVSADMHDGHVSVSMHPLVHAWARDRQNEQQQHESWVTVGCIVAFSRSDGDMWRVHVRQLQPHLHAMTSWDMHCMFGSEPTPMIVWILAGCGWLLHDMRDDTTLFMLLSRLCARLGLEKSSVDAQWIELYDLIGRNLENYGQVREAVTLLKEVVRIREQTLAEDHSDRLTSQHELARAYQANGQAKEAITLLKEVVRISDQTLAENHPDLLASQHELARAYQANGQVKEAITLLKEVIRIEEQTLAENHPSRLASQHALAGAYETNGQVKEAIILLKEVIRIREQTLTEDHPDRLASQQVLAGAYQANGQVKKALILLKKVVQIQEQTLAEDHPDRLASQHELAGAYQANGQVKEAVTLEKEVVRIEEQTLAEDYSSRLTSQHDLATMLWELGEQSAALQMMRHVVEIRKRVLDEHHPHRENSEAWLEYFSATPHIVHHT
jgi:tetratricopeptide (TPR) repeat protein